MKTLYSLLLGSLSVTGCATTDDAKSDQNISAPAGYEKAKDVDESKSQNADQAKIQYVPIPIPGQLKPVPGATGQPQVAKKNEKTGEEATKQANQKAIQTPASGDFFNSMMTYDFMDGALYTIYTAPLNITDIRLQKGEKIISQAAGDTMRWQVASTYSGEGDNVYRHLLVKPKKPGLTNSLIVTTDRRTYHLVLKSTDSDSYMVSVKWRYPSSMLKDFTSGQGADASPKPTGGDIMSGSTTDIAPPDSSQAADLNIDVADVNFDYDWHMVKGSTPAWYPVQVFSSGHQTYIKFDEKSLHDNTDMPVPVVKGSGGDYGTAGFNWRMKGQYMILDTVVDAAYLKSGTDDTSETIVAIDAKK